MPNSARTVCYIRVKTWESERERERRREKIQFKVLMLVFSLLLITPTRELIVVHNGHVNTINVDVFLFRSSQFYTRVISIKDVWYFHAFIVVFLISIFFCSFWFASVFNAAPLKCLLCQCRTINVWKTVSSQQILQQSEVQMCSIKYACCWHFNSWSIEFWFRLKSIQIMKLWTK